MKKDKDILIISIATFLSVIIWIGIDSYITYKKTAYTDINQNVLSPIDFEINFEGAL